MTLKRGDIDTDVDPDQTCAVLASTLYASTVLPLNASDVDFDESRNRISMMIQRFLQPQK